MASYKIASAVSAISLGIGVWAGSRYERVKLQCQPCVGGSTTSTTSNQQSNQDPPVDTGWAGVLTRFIPTLSAAQPILPVPGGPPATYAGNKVSQIMRYGLPTTTSNVRTYDEFVLAYDSRNRNAHWVFEHLTRDDVTPRVDVQREQCQFMADDSIHPYFRATNQDFAKSGYDRGHLAAAGNHRRSMRGMDQTFLLSNISPQVGEGFNRHAWNSLEKYVRGLTKRYSNLYVCTGPLYLPRPDVSGKMVVSYEVIGPRHVAVPTHFFKVVLGETPDGRFDLFSYVMPNSPLPNDIDLARYLVPVDTIERASGLLLFDRLPRDRIRMINRH